MAVAAAAAIPNMSDGNIFNAHQCLQAAMVYISAECCKYGPAGMPAVLAAAANCAQDCVTSLTAYDYGTPFLYLLGFEGDGRPHARAAAGVYGGAQSGRANTSLRASVDTAKNAARKRASPPPRQEQEFHAREEQRVVALQNPVAPRRRGQSGGGGGRHHHRRHQQQHQQQQQPPTHQQTQPAITLYGGRMLAADAVAPIVIDESRALAGAIGSASVAVMTAPTPRQPSPPPPTPASASDMTDDSLSPFSVTASAEIVIPIHAHPQRPLPSPPSTVLGVLAAITPEVATRAACVAMDRARAMREDDARLAGDEDAASSPAARSPIRPHPEEQAVATQEQLAAWRCHSPALEAVTDADPAAAADDESSMSRPWGYERPSDPYEEECAAQLARLNCGTSRTPSLPPDADCGEDSLMAGGFDWGEAAAGMDAAVYL